MIFLFRYPKEAEWCQLCYEFLVACDDRQVPVHIRLKYLKGMYLKLRNFIEIPHFPKYGANSASGVERFTDKGKEKSRVKYNGLPMVGLM